MNEAHHFAENGDDVPQFLLFGRVFMDRIKMTAKMDKTFEEGFEEYKSEKLNISKLARVCGISRTTIYKYLEVLKK